MCVYIMFMYVSIYIYICIERERCTLYISMYVCIYIYSVHVISPWTRAPPAPRGCSRPAARPRRRSRRDGRPSAVSGLRVFYIITCYMLLTVNLLLVACFSCSCLFGIWPTFCPEVRPSSTTKGGRICASGRGTGKPTANWQDFASGGAQRDPTPRNHA